MFVDYFYLIESDKVKNCIEKKNSSNEIQDDDFFPH